MSLTTHRSESNTSRDFAVVDLAFGSEPEPVSPAQRRRIIAPLLHTPDTNQDPDQTRHQSSRKDKDAEDWTQGVAPRWLLRLRSGLRTSRTLLQREAIFDRDGCC